MNRALIWVTALMGLSAMTGWMIGVDELIRVKQNFVSMKLPTALMFCLSSLIMSCIIDLKLKPVIRLVTCSMASFWMLGLCGIAALGHLIIPASFDPAIRDCLYGSSLSTLVCFVAVAIGGIVLVFNTNCMFRRFAVIGKIITLIASLALVGYALNFPFLRFDIPGIIDPMAFNTAVGLLAIGMFFLNVKERLK